MSVRGDIVKALVKGEKKAAGKAAANDNVVSLVAKRKKKRKMPPQGSKYDIVHLDRVPFMPWKFTDGGGTLYTRVSVNNKPYMRRADGIYYKPMRDGQWTSMLTPPKGAEAAWRRRKIAQGVAVAGAGAAGAVYAGDRK